MRAVTHRGSSLPSCRTGPGPHGTWRAMPASVPQPTGAPDTACRQRRPASPRRCVGCAPYSRVRRQPHGLKDCHTLCQTQVLGFLLGGLWSFDHNGVQGRLQQLGIVHVCGNLSGPPKTCLAHAPSAACHSQDAILRTPPPGLPTFGARRPSPPTVECDEWCCRPKRFRQSVPLAPAAQPEDDAVDHLSWRQSACGPGLWAGLLQDDRFDAQSSSGTSQMVSASLVSDAPDAFGAIRIAETDQCICGSLSPPDAPGFRQSSAGAPGFPRAAAAPCR